MTLFVGKHLPNAMMMLCVMVSCGHGMSPMDQRKDALLKGLTTFVGGYVREAERTWKAPDPDAVIKKFLELIELHVGDLNDAWRTPRIIPSRGAVETTLQNNMCEGNGKPILNDNPKLISDIGKWWNAKIDPYMPVSRWVLRSARLVARRLRVRNYDAARKFIEDKLSYWEGKFESPFLREKLSAFVEQTYFKALDKLWDRSNKVYLQFGGLKAHIKDQLAKLEGPKGCLTEWLSRKIENTEFEKGLKKLQGETAKWGKEMEERQARLEREAERRRRSPPPQVAQAPSRRDT